MHKQHSLLAATSLVLALAGCASDPADVAGDYAINVTNGANECDLDGWEVGATATNVGLAIEQREDAVTMVVQGITGAGLELLVGSRTFTGSVDGDRIEATLVGRAATRDSCAYTTVVDLTATANGDLLTGQLRWYAQTNGLPSCGNLNTCENIQTWNGARPPR